MTVNLATMPHDLLTLPQWVVWRSVTKPGAAKPTKQPFQAKAPRVSASSTNSLTWATVAEAEQALARDRTLDGIGFVFAAGGGHCGLDLDGVIDAAGRVAPWAQQFVKVFATYTEKSPSGTGLHLIGAATLSGTGRKCGPLEVYDRGRFFTMTGHALPGTPPDLRDCQQEISHLTVCMKVMADALTRYGDRFSVLFAGDWPHATDATGTPYPSQSEADLALCSMAAQCGATAVEIDALIRLSGLHRQKWDTRHGADTYGALTIATALHSGASLSWGSAPTAGSAGPQAVAKATQAQTLRHLASAAHLLYTPEGMAYARVPVNGHYEVLGIAERGAGLRQWLLHQFEADTGGLPNANAITQVMEWLGAKARFDGERADVFTRYAAHGETLYLDLGGADWRAVEIDAAGWRLVDQPPVYFRRPAGLLPLPEPDPAGSLAALDALLPPLAADHLLLVKAWLLSTLQPDGGLPVLCLHGEQGSAKSTMTRMLRSIMDPNKAPAQRPPKDEHNLVIAASNGLVVALENLSYLPAWLSDFLCTLSTGAGYRTRKNYTDSEETLFAAKRPVVMNGIAEVAVRGDLVDRCLFVTLPAMAKQDRRKEQDVWATFAAAHAALLGGLLKAVSTALRERDAIFLPELPRMADFTVWTEAAHTALGVAPGAFLSAYKTNREAGVTTVLEESTVAQTLMAYIDSKGNVQQALVKTLLDNLTDHVTNQYVKPQPKGWPQSARSLAGELRRLAPALLQTGYTITFQPHTNGGNPVSVTK